MSYEPVKPVAPACLMLGTFKVMLGPGLHFLFLQGSGSGAVAGHPLSLTSPPFPV